MFSTSQDILYVTVSICIALFTFFLVWIMYYIVQISKQSNEMISDFRQKMEELDATVHAIKDKVNTSVDRISSLSDQVGNILEVITRFTNRGGSRRKRRAADED